MQRRVMHALFARTLTQQVFMNAIFLNSTHADGRVEVSGWFTRRGLLPRFAFQRTGDIWRTNESAKLGGQSDNIVPRRLRNNGRVNEEGLFTLFESLRCSTLTRFDGFIASKISIRHLAYFPMLVVYRL